ncbi:anti-sigma factor [Gymnodinialimonas ulvae]|uniref:anti-sigma factor n=1 Tax=Gymnodinialimonas ulvae TaxID=3126504 RepID=UPI0030AE1C7D
MTQPTDISPDDNALAAEYVLGLLPADELAGFEVRLRRETSLFALVASWQSEFAALAEAEVDSAMPPRALQSRIEARLFDDNRPTTWSPLAIWRGLALAGFASSLALAAILIFNTAAPVEPQPAFVAQLAPVTGEAQFVALFDPDVATLRVQQAAGVPLDNRVQELWLIAGDAAPVSLGLLAAGVTTSITVSEDLRAVLTEAVLAVSDEPPGGSPTGAPTGDVLAAGPVISL